MIGVHIIAEWLAAFIESILYFKIVSVIFETQFSKKKQIKFGLFLSAFIAIGIVMLNMVDLSISLPTLGYAAISYTLGGKILYRGRFSEFLLIAIGYIAFLTGMDMGTVFLMTKLGMTSVIEIVLSDFGIERIIFIVFIKLVECLLVCLFCEIIKKDAEKKNKSGITITVICLVVGSIGGVYWIVSSQILLGIRLDFLQMLLGISGVLLAGVVYLFLRMRENRKEQEYIEQKNHFLEQNYLVAKESYESNAKLYHDMWNHFLLIQKYLEKGQIAEAQKYLLKLIGNHTEYMIEVQEELAALVNLSPTHVSVIERGLKVAKLDTFIAIANALDVSADTLLIDVVTHSVTGVTNELSEMIEKLPKEKQQRIINAVRALVE